MHYEVKINEFCGPLDLLLHLIKKSNISIYDISLEEITNQYLDYINCMKKLNLDIASEYLVMASELLEYKSRSLLPKKEDTVEEEEDLKEDLINRLIDYKKYKEITSTFKILENNRSYFYTKTPSNISEYSDKRLDNSDVSVDDLISAFKKFLERKDYEKPIHTKITSKELSINERIDNIRGILKNKSEVNFIDLFDKYNKSYVVVTFLSILEMSKNKEIEIIQDNNFSNILIRGSEV